MKPALLVSLTLAGALALSSCAQQRTREQVQAATTKRDAAITACMADLPKEPGNFVRRQQCMSSAREAWAAETGFRDLDLIYAADANAMQDAVKADQGQISPAQYEADVHSVWAGVALVQHQRNEDAQAVQFQRSQAASNALLQWSAMQQRQAQPGVAPLPQSFRCTTRNVGGTAYTDCN